MNKILKFISQNILKIGIGFLLIFIPLYPKLPSIQIPHTWVYIRLEDFFIMLIVFIWVLQLLLKRAKLPPKLWIPLGLYWLIGLLSLLFSLIFIAPHLANFFPGVAVLFYLRRIEYMILFFVAFSTIKSIKDLKHYLIALSVSVLGFSLYAFGQRFYINLWNMFPDFFKNISFCFPSFQTGNEEFAKGIPLCLPEGARINSTFAGHYDLGAYLVLVIPIFLTLIFSVKSKLAKILLSLLTLCSMTVLIFTSSRISFLAYLLAGIIALVFINRKKWVIPFFILSICLLLYFSGSTAKRFMETFRFASVVTNNQGQIVGQAELPKELRDKISHNVIANIPSQNLPVGTGYLGLPQINDPTKTNSAIVQSSLSVAEAKRLKLENGGVEISTVSGTFLVRKVLVYDISFTTRFQAEWPNAWGAMLRNPLLGSGFATITLAADNDYLRILGETGLLGLISFLSIFIIFAITAKQSLSSITDKISKFYVLGIAAGVIGLFFNAVLIDVFESSKVSESLWILLGIALGTVFLFKNNFEYKKYLKNILTSQFFVLFYLFFLSIVFYMKSFVNFFVADDFTWLKWAANTNLRDLPRLFIDSQGFFYRPLDKVVVYFLYTFFSFSPQGYHIFMFAIHFLIAIGVYIFIHRLFNSKVYSFFGAFVFLFLPSSAENIYWISTVSTNLCALFIIYGLLLWQKFRSINSKKYLLLSFVFGILAFLSYEMAVVYPLLIVLFDIFISKSNNFKKNLILYIPLFILIPIYWFIRIFSHSVSPGGDYAYNLVHLIPNIFGNFLGYLALLMFGESSLNYYTLARNLLKEDFIYVMLFLIFAIIVLFVVLFLNKKRLLALIKNDNFKFIIFSLLFIFISLIPFLGLGNISERYSYLSSFGFAFLVVLIFKQIITYVKKENFKIYTILLITIILGLFYYQQSDVNNEQWHEAGRITNRTLGFLRLYYDGKRPYSNFYFVNVPIRKANAWIFPVGLPDGVWFIYRDDSINVYNLSSLKDGRKIPVTNQFGMNYVFAFDKNGNIYAVK